MNKAQFLEELARSLYGLSDYDINRSLDYYEEMIDDRVEDGMSEEQAVAALGSVEEIRARILDEIPMRRIVGERMKPKKKMSGLAITLLAIGSVVWLPLLLALLIICLALYISFFAIIFSLYVSDLAVFVSGLACTVVGLLAPMAFYTKLFYVGSGIALVGSAILLFFLFTLIAKGMLFIGGKIALGIKMLFVGGR
ncbi:MAG: DUF1700 domain-containing protein [Lachnospiraceae bacterium]|nr:DUF1700 domain-containing protein [Lachnospiraceae bacterium]